MSSLFGGRDPFDDPFFSRPFGSSVFDSTFLKDNKPGANRSSGGVVIKELGSDDEPTLLEDNDNTEDIGKINKDQNTSAGAYPVIELPDDQFDEGANKRRNMEISQRTHSNKVKGPQTQSISFQRVTYGGMNGTYYTSTTTRKSGSDGVVLEESRQADRTTGEATHRISRGVHDKGHSVTRKLNVDGKVDTMQALHNLEEDELASFEQTWKGTADRHLPRWKEGFADLGGSRSRSNGGFATWSGRQPFGETGLRNGRDAKAETAGRRPKKVVNITIDCHY